MAHANKPQSPPPATIVPTCHVTNSQNGPCTYSHAYIPSRLIRILNPFAFTIFPAFVRIHSFAAAQVSSTVHTQLIPILLSTPQYQCHPSRCPATCILYVFKVAMHPTRSRRTLVFVSLRGLEPTSRTTSKLLLASQRILNHGLPQEEDEGAPR
jgi:hypothetical protein